MAERPSRENPQHVPESPADLLARLYCNRKLSDVKFLVGEERREFFASRCVLAAKSKWFESLLFGEQRRGSHLRGRVVVPINDVDADTFEFILRFIYLNDIASLSFDNLPEVLLAAIQFQLTDLENICEKYVEHHLRVDVVCSIYARTLGRHDRVARTCLDFILRHSDSVFSLHQNSLNMTAECWEAILSHQDRSGREIVIFKALVAHFRYKYASQHIFAAESHRLLHRVNFQKMTFQEILGTVVDSGILEESEIIRILRAKAGLNGRKKNKVREFQVFVKTLSGTTITCNVKESDMIEDLKMKIQDKEGIPPSVQRLTYGGKSLLEGHTISEYEISKEATIHILLKQSAFDGEGRLSE
eukprot:52833_1